MHRLSHEPTGATLLELASAKDAAARARKLAALGLSILYEAPGGECRRYAPEYLVPSCADPYRVPCPGCRRWIRPTSRQCEACEQKGRARKAPAAPRPDDTRALAAWDLFTAEEWRAMYWDGASSCAMLAERLGLAPMTIYRALRHHGIPLREPGAFVGRKRGRRKVTPPAPTPPPAAEGP